MADAMNEAPDAGQVSDQGNQLDAAAESAMAEMGGAEGGQPDAAPASPFLDFEVGGKKVQFSSADEARAAFKNGYLMQSDYTRKTQSHAEEVRKFNEERDSLMKQIQEQKSKYDKYGELLKQNPALLRQLQESRNKPLTPQDAAEVARNYANEQVNPLQKEVEELKSWRAQREAQESREKLYAELSGEIDGFSRENVESLMKEFNPRDMKQMITLLHHAHRGMNPRKPESMDVRAARSEQEKLKARMAPVPGAANEQVGTYGSLDEAEAAALREMT